jgi:hypothetical protein
LGTGDDKTFLMDQIKASKKKGLISSKPIIVLDGIPFRYSKELKDNSLSILKSEIEKIDVLKKDVGIGIYGDEANAGVVIITTRTNVNNSAMPVRERSAKSIDDSKVLLILDGKEITQSELESIDPNDVETIEVIKDQEKVKEFTLKKYDGVVIITMKK